MSSRATRPVPGTKRKRHWEIPGIISPLRQYVISCCAIFGATVACFFASRYVDYRSVGMFLLFIISVLSLFFGRGPLFSAAVLSAISWDYLFIPPVFTFSISHPSDVMMVSLFFVVALASGDSHFANTDKRDGRAPQGVSNFDALFICQ